jgi:hypothetical protein
MTHSGSHEGKASDERELRALPGRLLDAWSPATARRSRFHFATKPPLSTQRSSQWLREAAARFARNPALSSCSAPNRAEESPEPIWTQLPLFGRSDHVANGRVATASRRKESRAVLALT